MNEGVRISMWRLMNLMTNALGHAWTGVSIHRRVPLSIRIHKNPLAHGRCLYSRLQRCEEESEETVTPSSSGEGALCNVASRVRRAGGYRCSSSSSPGSKPPYKLYNFRPSQGLQLLHILKLIAARPISTTNYHQRIYILVRGSSNEACVDLLLNT